MKRKLFILLLLPILLLSLTGCNKEKKENTKNIILEDEKLGYKTTFTYPEKEKYTNIKENDGGFSKSISFENEDLDIEFEMYYNKLSIESYKDGEKNRKNQKNYKKYTFGEYEGYGYSEYDDNLYLVIKLDESDKKNVAILYVSMNRIDNNKDVVVSKLLSEDKLKEFYNSMKYENTKKKKD